jgi:hypothetical protein
MKFLDKVSDEARRRDCLTIVEMMSKATKSEPKMWGTSIVGFGTRRLKYSSGREIDWMIIGFSPRKQDLTLYLSNCGPLREEVLAKLGKHKTGKGCLYLKALDDVHLPTLKKLIADAVKGLTKSK